jgi:selenium metabolism protein YedF
MMKTAKIDARKLACPQPVVLTKKALAEGSFERLEVMVDNEAAVSNVTRFVNHAGFQVCKTEKTADGFLISIEHPPSAADSAESKISSVNQNSSSEIFASCTVMEFPDETVKTVLLGNDTMGKGDRELGRLLMGAFIYTLTQIDRKPGLAILLNSGVKLAVHGAKELEDLQKLEEDGMEILVCGTCLDYYQLKEKLAVGKISNMYDIAEQLTAGRVLSL